MHNNFHFLKHLTRQLKEEFVGFSIGEVYSQAKNEIIFSLYNGTKYRFIKGHMSPQFCCISFPDIANRAKKNSVDLLPAIIDKKIIDVVQIENDRSFYFQLSGEWKLLFKMHGNRSNVVLFDKNTLNEVFRSSLKLDYHISLNSLSKQITFDFNTFKQHEGDYKKLVPTLGKSFDDYFNYMGYDEFDDEKKHKCLNDLISYLDNPDYFIHLKSNNLPQLCLYKINKPDTSFSNPIEAINNFFRKYISSFYLEKEKSTVRGSISNQIKKAEAYINKSSQKLSKLQSASNYKHIGDLIMANLHQMKPYAHEVELIDFYTHRPVLIPLKSNLTPQHNAEKYYARSKKQQIEIETLERNLKSKERTKEQLLRELAAIEQMTNIRQVQKSPISKLQKIDAPYHVIEFMGHEILVGKNAKRNEVLTFQHARKDDLFLHAKDSPGSHVIIKKTGKQNFPQSVIEKAASFAAYNSKNKTGALCRVLYTPKKYVRKMKGAPSGTVIVEKEKVILVKPEKI